MYLLFCLQIGVAGLVFVSVLTAHCCHLLVKCRYHALAHIMRRLRHPSNFMLKAHRCRPSGGINLQVNKDEVDAFIERLVQKGLLIWPPPGSKKGKKSLRRRSSSFNDLYPKMRTANTESKLVDDYAKPKASVFQRQVSQPQASCNGVSAAYENGVYQDVHWMTDRNKIQQNVDLARIAPQKPDRLGASKQISNGHTVVDMETPTEKAEHTDDNSGPSASYVSDEKMLYAEIDSNQSSGRVRSSSAHNIHRVRRNLAKNLQYGDLARLCLGSFGVVFTNFLLVITQVGFFISYSIFTANAIVGFFPVHNCTASFLQNGSANTDLSLLYASQDCRYLGVSPWKHWMKNQENWTEWNSIGSSYKLFPYPLDNNYTAVIKDMLAPKRIIIPLADDSVTSPVEFSQTVIPSSLLSPSSEQEEQHFSGTVSTRTEFQQLLSELTTSPSLKNVLVKKAANVPSNEMTVSANIMKQSTELEPSQAVPYNSTIISWSKIFSDAPDLRLMVLVPLVVFLFIVQPRKLRVLGIFSAIANVGLIVGIIILFGALINGIICSLFYLGLAVNKNRKRNE
jgi:hypothetical protein